MTLQEWTQTIGSITQIIGIVLAAAWGVHTWIWKEVVVPNRAPASLNVELSLSPIKRAGTAMQGEQPLPMALQITATNPSSRTLYLLPGYWQLLATRLKPDPGGVFYQERANEALSDSSIAPAERHSEPFEIRSLATGKLFSDDTIMPGETLKRQLIIHIPSSYPTLDVDLLLPVLSRPPHSRLFKGKQLRWGYAPPTTLFPRLCSGEGEALNCTAVDVAQLDQAMRAFDPRSTVFSRSIQVTI